MSAEQLAEIQARIKAASSHVQTVVGETSTPPPLIRGPDRQKPRAGKPVVFAMSEREVLRECSRILDQHPCVALWWRNNVGAGLTLSGRYVKFSFRGASDLMLVSTAGRFGAVECKATGKKATADQDAFLANVRTANGFAACVDHPGKLALALKAL